MARNISPSPNPKRRPLIQITLGRAARLHRLVRLLADAPQPRDAILAELGIGLRTFYRELELLNRCAVRVRLRDKTYVLHSTIARAEEQLPFPNPHLSFAEMAELAAYQGEASKRLAGLLDRVVNATANPRNREGRVRKAKPKKT